ncbi:MAG: hypothetical protein M1351_02290 [Candidatus Thermoplasmatota archaeon]|nr:hypothetical protein [Candidatus Thermoplasmatota archaeon]
MGDATDTTNYIRAMKELSEWRRFMRSYARAYVRDPSPANFEHYASAVDNCFALMTKALRAGVERNGSLK